MDQQKYWKHRGVSPEEADYSFYQMTEIYFYQSIKDINLHMWLGYISLHMQYAIIYSFKHINNITSVVVYLLRQDMRLLLFPQAYHPADYFCEISKWSKVHVLESYEQFSSLWKIEHGSIL